MKRALFAIVALSALGWSCTDWDSLGCDAGDLSYCNGTGGGAGGGGEPVGGGASAGGDGGATGGGGGATGGGGETGGGGGTTGGGGGTTGGGGGTTGGGGGTTGGGGGTTGGGGGTTGGGGGTTGGGGGTTGGGGGATGGGTGGGATGGGGGASFVVVPSYGRRGDVIEVNGVFDSPSMFEFVDGTNTHYPCTSTVVVSSLKVRCTVPALPLGRYSLSFLDAATSVTIPNAFVSLGEPLAWFDLTDRATVTLNSTTVAQAVDRSDAGIVVSNTNPAQQPVFQSNALAGLHTLRFTAQTYLPHNSLPLLVSGNGARVVAIVGRFSSTTPSGQVIFAYGGSSPFSLYQMGGAIQVDNTSGGLLTPTLVGVNAPFYLIAHCPGGLAPLTSCVVRANGVNPVSTTAVGNAAMGALNTNGNGFFLGKSSGSFSGDLSELVFYGALTTPEVDALEEYLRTKFSL